MSDQDAQRAEAEKRIKEEELRAGIRKRPILASIIAVILMLVGFLTVLVAIFVLLVTFGIFASFPILGGTLTTIGAVTGGLVFLIGLILFMTGTGLWKLKKWALYLVALPIVLYVVLVAAGAAMTGDFVGFFLGFGMCASPVFIIALIFMIYFIAIRKQFS